MATAGLADTAGAEEMVGMEAAAGMERAVTATQEAWETAVAAVQPELAVTAEMEAMGATAAPAVRVQTSLLIIRGAITSPR